MKAVLVAFITLFCSLSVSASAATGGDLTKKVTTTSGVSLTFNNPDFTKAYKPGDNITIGWAIDGPFDPTFIGYNITFDINDATVPTNVLPVANGTFIFAAQPTVGDSFDKTSIPSVYLGKSYVIRAAAKDPTSGNPLYWYSPTFTINGPPAPVVATTGGAAATTASKTSGSERVHAKKTLKRMKFIAVLSALVITAITVSAVIAPSQRPTATLKARDAEPDEILERRVIAPSQRPTATLKARDAEAEVLLPRAIAPSQKATNKAISATLVARDDDDVVLPRRAIAPSQKATNKPITATILRRDGDDYVIPEGPESNQRR
ncbi:UNVERIFIED_CONTAM: hypothetical protein HDU68_006372 [Siphonaria sp. JEL0065]|nr:hypothetical protein HDU68_006372 [Siphonaria sp. JEL0065]